MRIDQFDGCHDIGDRKISDVSNSPVENNLFGLVVAFLIEFGNFYDINFFIDGFPCKCSD